MQGSKPGKIGKMVMRKVQEEYLLKHSAQFRINWAREQLGKKQSGSFIDLQSYVN
jgi:hypothetical protein